MRRLVPILLLLCACQRILPEPSDRPVYAQRHSALTTDVTGTWLTTLTYAGVSCDVYLQVHQRTNGKVLGYVLGGLPAASVSEGSYDAVTGALALTVELAAPHQGTPRDQVFLAADMATGATAVTQASASGSQTTTLTLLTDTFMQRRLVLGRMDPSQGGMMLRLEALLDAQDHVVTGSWTRWVRSSSSTTTTSTRRILSTYRGSGPGSGTTIRTPPRPAGA